MFWLIPDFCYSNQGNLNMAQKLQNGLKIIRRKQVEARVGLSRSTIYEKIKSGSFPSPISLGSKSVGWIDSEIDEWLISQIEKSRRKQLDSEK
jgi:prophage regulatory protein